METKYWTTEDIPEGSDALEGAFVARDYHGGQMTALYAMSSTGSLELYKGEGFDRLIRELGVAIVDAHNNGNEDDAYAISRFHQWVVDRQWEMTKERETV